MARPGGVLEIRGPYETLEYHTSTCAHCGHVTVFVNPKQMQQVVDFCRGCSKLICLNCAGKPCRPWEQEMERQEARYLMLKDMGLA